MSQQFRKYGRRSRFGEALNLSLLIEDTFTDTNATSITSHTPDTNIPGGTWQLKGSGANAQIDNNKLKILSTSGEGRTTRIDAGVTDIVVDLDVQALQTFAGVTLSYKEDTIFFRIGLNYDSGTGETLLQIDERNWMKSPSLQTKTSVSVESNIGTMRVIKNGSLVSVEFPIGTRKISDFAIDITSELTFVGVSNFRFNNLYDNFKVYEIL